MHEVISKTQMKIPQHRCRMHKTLYPVIVAQRKCD